MLTAVADFYTKLRGGPSKRSGKLHIADRAEWKIALSRKIGDSNERRSAKSQHTQVPKNGWHQFAAAD
jgi:hypothetical protein